MKVKQLLDTIEREEKYAEELGKLRDFILSNQEVRDILNKGAGLEMLPFILLNNAKVVIEVEISRLKDIVDNYEIPDELVGKMDI